MNRAQTLIESFGGLRDAVMTGFQWSLGEKTVLLAFDDVTSGLTEPVNYRGPKPGELVFNEVVSVFMTVDPIEGALQVYELRLVEEMADHLVAEIKFRPGGTLTVNCGGIGFKGGRMNAEG